MIAVALAIVIVVASGVTANRYQYEVASVTFNPDTQAFILHNGHADNSVAWATFNDTIDSNGWSQLVVFTDEKYPDLIQAFSAGVVEAHLTRVRIYQHWINNFEGYCDGQEDYCKRLEQFLVENWFWMVSKMMDNAETDPYWHQVMLMIVQLQGLMNGYHMNFHKMQPLHQIKVDLNHFLMFNIMGDLEDLEQALGRGKCHTIGKPSSKCMKWRPVGATGLSPCSAIVKPLKGNSDILISHVTWSPYNMLLKIIKKYSFNYHLTNDPNSSLVASPNISMSSYPGDIFSMDDFYITSSKLTVLETTNGNNNTELWKDIVPQGTLLSWIRTMVANRLAKTGKSWTQIFAQHNSGTYNNQFMVIDFKLFQPGMKTLPSGLFWIIEQIPGLTHSKDMSAILDKQRYWPSYNSPYFPDIYNQSGMRELVNKYGDFFNHNKTCRAKIFEKYQSKVTDFETLIWLMRYNDFKNDPLSRCDTCNPPYTAVCAISARSDLMPANGTYPFFEAGHWNWGGLDMKATGFEMSNNLEMIAQAGPTFSANIPPFRWSTSDFNSVPHLGMPDLWQFDPIHVHWKN